MCSMSVVKIITHWRALSNSILVFISELSDSVWFFYKELQKGEQSVLQVLLASLLSIVHITP